MAITALVVVFLDASIVNVANASISVSLRGGLVLQQWDSDAHTLTLAAFILAAGALSDTLGRVTTMKLGVLGFGIASLLRGGALGGCPHSRAHGPGAVRCSPGAEFARPDRVDISRTSAGQGDREVVGPAADHAAAAAEGSTSPGPSWPLSDGPGSMPGALSITALAVGVAGLVGFVLREARFYSRSPVTRRARPPRR